jgi:hypothetical protein
VAADLQQLQDDVLSWMTRRDIVNLIPGWLLMLEAEIAETCRTRCQVVFGDQIIDAPTVTMPPDFATMESIRDASTGELLNLEDEWTGHWTAGDWNTTAPVAPIGGPVTSYRLVGNCIEWLPHPMLPAAPDPSYVFQSVRMGWYQKPTPPLTIPSSTNPILQTHYAIYLFGLCKYAAMWALDDDRMTQMDAAFQQQVTRANLWKQGSDYSGAPYCSEMACVF